MPRRRAAQLCITNHFKEARHANSRCWLMFRGCFAPRRLVQTHICPCQIWHTYYLPPPPCTCPHVLKWLCSFAATPSISEVFPCQDHASVSLYLESAIAPAVDSEAATTRYAAVDSRSKGCYR